MAHLKNEPAAVLVAHDDALLSRRAVCAMAGVARPTLDKLIAAHGFPSPIRFSLRCHRWRAGDVRAWIRAQATASAT